MDSDRHAIISALGSRLYSRTGARHVAVVGALLAALSQHNVRIVDCFASLAHLSGNGEGERIHGGLTAWHYGHFQRGWADFLGLGLRFDVADNCIFPDVPGRSPSFLDVSLHRVFDAAGPRYVRRRHVLWWS